VKKGKTVTGIRVLVVENDPFTLTTLVNACEYQRVSVVGRATTARDALELQRETEPDVALLDLDLGIGPTGVDLAHALRIRQPEIGIVMLSTYRDPRLFAPGMIEPPRGTVYLSKSDIGDFALIVDRILGVARMPLANRKVACGSIPALTDVQLDVLRMVSEGMSTQAIAEARQVSVKAVEQNISRLSEILDVPRDSSNNQRVQLARAYLELAGKIKESQG
jgi:DNA-binding NarL/FixJ family response regulator